MAFGKDDTPKPIKDEDIIMIAKMAGLSVAEVMEKIAKGWEPPQIRR